MIPVKLKFRMVNKLKSQHPTELETTFIIRSEHPIEIASRIAALDSISGFPLRVQKTKINHDIYWDTRDNQLYKKKLSLRLREVGQNLLLTIKGEAKTTEWGGVARLEIEVRWSPEGLTEILSALSADGIALQEPEVNSDRDNALEILRSLGLHIIQNRETERKVRNITAENSETIFAELVIDTVFYKIRNRLIRHFEIEIESKHKKGVVILKKIGAELGKQFGAEIEIWTHSKLTTGMAFEKLLSPNNWHQFIGGDQTVYPVTYNKLAKILQSEKNVI
ncbi:MAG TPA: CYTH domain-containing protein [Bacteroidetes bacterium]|nr:CYTH domain-containing protein [Bacteroidota bacterium]